MALLNTTQQEYYNQGDYGNYQFISLEDIINQFVIAYVGEGKIISKVKRTDISFFAQRALAELSFDTFKSCKAQEIVVPATLQMILPRDYVNYTKISWVDSSGIKHPLYPTNKTSNPFKYQIDSNDEFLFDASGNKILSGNLIQNGNYHGGTANWILNVENNASGSNTIHPTTTSAATATLGDPEQGWFYGFDGNAVRAYDLPQWHAVRQDNVAIIPGEKYKLTYTLSGYTSGEWYWHIIDKNGDTTFTANRTANGTYEEIITHGTTTSGGTAAAAAYPPESIFFRSRSVANGNVTLDNVSFVRIGDEETSTTWSNYKSNTPSENNNDDYEDDTYWPANGERYGLDPQHAQVNGSFYIDCETGKIHFSSNISGKTIVLDYISDTLGTEEEMKVHKFAEEAMYKCIAHAVLSTRMNTPEYLVQRLKKEKFAETRKAKLRLSNINLEEITQVLRGKSKQIKH